MKKLIFLFAICLPNIINAQALKYSRAYLGAMIHDGRPGGSLILSYGANKYLGIGAGVDLTTYVNKGYSSRNTNSKLFGPFYADVRFKYPLKAVEPFILGQFGKPAYNEHVATFTDVTGVPKYQLYQNGKYFYGIGIGASAKPKKVGVFASMTFRSYNFSYTPDNISVNGRPIPDPKAKEVIVITAGLVF